ncbi:MAG: hypothetical protein ABIJ18_04875 [archaeon]
MKTRELLIKLEGLQTIKSVMALLSIDKQKAIYYIYRLRKKGYVKTSKFSDNTRVYNISYSNRFKGINYYDILNKYSPVKLVKKTYITYGVSPTLEETLIFAIKTKSLRTILASLALFKHIEDWSQLYQLAKKNHIEREVGALYDLARKIMRTRRMTKRFRNNALPKEDNKCYYIIDGLKSKNFKEIENTWKVYIPFNKQDLEDYK